jgi:hypothetical protein
MSQQPTLEQWVGNPSTHFMLAAMFLALGVAWLVWLSGDILSYWLPAGLLLAAGTILTVRGVTQLASRRSPQ